MNEMLLDSLKQSVSKSRYQHTLGVMEIATKMAIEYNLDEDKVKLAAIGHDITKEYDKDRQLEILQDMQVDDAQLLRNPNIWHAMTAVFELENIYNIFDEQVLNAVKYHTIGDPEMDDIAKVIFIADYCEPGRTNPDADVVRAMIGLNLDMIMLHVVTNNNKYLEKRGFEIHINTLKLFEKLSK